MATGCLTEQQIHDLAASRKSLAEAPLLLKHLETCSSCQHIFDEWRANLDFIPKIDLSQSNKPGSLRTSELDKVSHHGQGVRLSAADHELDIPGYQIIREIHRGGQGIVYEALQLSTQRTVAVKVLIEGRLAGERAKWRFEQEVKLIAALKHPNIVTIHDSGIISGRYYFAMDYVRGQPLDTHVRLSRPPLRSIISLFAQVVEPVAYAHRRGVIHRDLKPSNILVSDSGSPCVLDFGLAKIVGEELKGSQPALASMPGNLLGTLRYMSPEHTWGIPEDIDIRTDVYSLGVILYELLTGQAPYPTNVDLAEALRTVREVDPVRPSRLRREISAELDAIVLKAMAKEPERRYQSAGEFVDDLRAWLAGLPVAARSASSLYVLRKLAVRHYFHTSVIAALIASIVGFGGISWHALGREREAKRELEGINRQFTQDKADLATRLKWLHNQHWMSWFLLEWQAGHDEGARQIMKVVAPESPEQLAMSYLADHSFTSKQLLERLAADPGLAWLAIGEGELKAGRVHESQKAYDQCMHHDGPWRSLAQLRSPRTGSVSTNPVKSMEQASGH